MNDDYGIHPSLFIVRDLTIQMYLKSYPYVL